MGAVHIYDISRLARDLRAHIELRTMIGGAGGRLESPTMEFGEDSDSILVENLLASVSQHQRQKNAEQVGNRMRARVMNGYWVFYPPLGYRYQVVQGHGKLLVRDEPIATVVQEALKGFASGRFRSAAEIQRFFQHQPCMPRNSKGEVDYKLGDDMLRRVIYAGYLNFEKWDIHLVPGKHEPLITYEEYERIQDRLSGNKLVHVRKDLHEDFVLRGHVACAACGNPMTAAWTKGRSAYYPYYECHQKECPQRRKSIRRAQIEDDFAALLQELRPAAGLYNLIRDMLTDLWTERSASLKDRARKGLAEVAQIEKRIEAVVTRITEAGNSAVISAYETEIKKLEARRVALKETAEAARKPLKSFDATFRTAMAFLANPYKIWENGGAADRKLVLRLVFPTPVAYCRNEGFRTAAIPVLLRLYSPSDNANWGMVEPRGVEPLTS
ncbi:MAG: recombinase zinc beta ribbon domain-containing protein [Pikeienuella sp.]